jgi:isopenicillin-N epimerase
MGVVRIPTPAPATAEWAQRLRRRLLDARTDAPVHALDGAIWLRLSAFAYNELSDFEALASVVASVL